MSDYDDFSEMGDSMFEALTEAEQIEAEDMLMHKAFNNSYRMVTKETTFTEILDAEPDGMTAVAHDVDNGHTTEDLENMIAFFEEYEEYEKCGVLLKLLNTKE